VQRVAHLRISRANSAKARSTARPNSSSREKKSRRTTLLTAPNSVLLAKLRLAADRSAASSLFDSTTDCICVASSPERRERVSRSIDVDLPQLGGDRVTDARIIPDESLLAVEYWNWRGRLKLMRGVPADR
jgi:hypothetical protein